MHLLINKNKIYFYIFSFIFLTTISNTNLLKKIKINLTINKIEIETNNSNIKNQISELSNFLYNKNILFIDKELITKNFNNLGFLENLKIIKNYPSTLIIKASKTNLVGITIINKKKYYIGSNGNFILSSKIKSENTLPFIFGKFDIENYLNLISVLKKHNLNTNKITKYYYHKNKRWDLYYEDNILIKLPNTKIEKAIEKYKSLKKEIKPNATIDLRIANRVIIKHD